MKKIILSILLITASYINGQTNKLPKGFLKSINAEDLKRHLNYIAGPETEGRGTGTPGLAKAANYIENHFKQLGLKPAAADGFQQAYDLFQDSVLASTITIGEQVFDYYNHFGANNRNNKSENLSVNEMVYVGFGIDDKASSDYSDYANIDVKNKIVIVNDGEPKLNDTTYIISGTKKKSAWSWQLDLKVEAAARHGAAAIFFLNLDKSNRMWSEKAGGIYPAHVVKPKTINRYALGKKMSKTIIGDLELTKGLVIQKKVDIKFNTLQIKSKATNVAGILEGTDKKDEYIVITAHMDHLGKEGNTIYYGADDDGSGTCAILELAEAFAKSKAKGKAPRRSIVFMTVSGEEKGLWGSKYYTLNPLLPLEKTSVNLNIDMIGRIGYDYVNDAKDSANYVYIIGDDKLSTDLRPFNEKGNQLSSKLKLDYRYNDPKDPNRFYFRSDHYNFAEKGVPIIFYFDGEHKDYHKPTDTPEKINYNLYMRRAKLVASTAWLMANTDEMLKRDLKLERGEN